MTQTDFAQLLLSAKRVDLSHPVSDEIPKFSALEILTEKDIFNIDTDGFYAKEYTLPSQYGTHIDAPINFTTGKSNFEEKVELNSDFTVSVSDIQAYEEENGEIRAGSFVAFSSGWSRRWEDHDAFYNKDESGVSHTPGWSVEALEYLHKERQVTAIGHETLDTDSGVDYALAGSLPAEYYWLALDKHQVEVMNHLDQL